MKTTLQTATLTLLLLIITAIPAWAGQGVGTGPYTADLLVSGLNTGELNPGQEYWYAYSRLDLGDAGYNSVILSLNFEAEGRAIASRVNFQVFSFEQVESWLRDSSGPVDSLGLGTVASADFDVNTGERFWSGPVLSNDVYYVRIFNLSPSPVQFRLTALGQKNPQLDQLGSLITAPASGQTAIPAAVSVGSADASSSSLAESGIAAQPAADPRSLAVDLPVQPDDSPFSTSWLLAAQAINGLPPNEAAAWLMSAAMLGWLPTGVNGSPPQVPANPADGVPLVSVGGGNDDDPGSGQVPAPPDPTTGENIYPNQPVQLLEGTNTGRMSPKSEQWYTFTAGKVDAKVIENYSLTMFFTPGEPNLAQNVTFQLFTGDQYQIWERGTADDMRHFGAGSWVSRDDDYNTGERLWHGTVVDGGQYFVKLTNATNEWVDYHLITGDIYNIEMGEPLVNKITARPVDTTPTGKDIGSPLPIGKGHQVGTLAARDEIWFQFEYTNPNVDSFEFDPFLMRLDHTPGEGHITNHVNFEIYPYQEQHLWRRGDTDEIEPLGAGSKLAYDRTSNTHSWIWDGHLVSNTIYFIRVRNGSITDIDYDLFIRRK
ncbi:MAG: hypothetical protein R3264_00870 [Anaerolineae bacterium]|nr:hypothetical protein [Anaerolineae bacterium]